MSCPAISTEQTISVTQLYITTTLDQLVLDAQTCGEFTGLYAYPNDGFLYNTGVDLTQMVLDNQVIGAEDASLHLELTATDLGISGADIDTIIVFRFTNTRTATDGSTVTETKLASVASYASVYPCLINKIDNIDAGCNNCDSLNNALLISLLMDTVTTYITYERFADAVRSYQKIKVICREYDLLYSTIPTVCDLYGGIGCWIINSTFQVTGPTGIYVPDYDSIEEGM